MICTRDAAGKNGSEVNVGGGGESLSPPLSLVSARGFAQRLPRPNKVTSHKAGNGHGNTGRTVCAAPSRPCTTSDLRSSARRWNSVRTAPR